MFIKNSAPHIVLLQLLSICLANIILIGLIIYEQKNQDKLSNDEKKIILYSEFILSFIGSSVLLLFMSYFIYNNISILYLFIRILKNKSLFFKIND